VIPGDFGDFPYFKPFFDTWVLYFYVYLLLMLLKNKKMRILGKYELVFENFMYIRLL